MPTLQLTFFNRLRRSFVRSRKSDISDSGLVLYTSKQSIQQGAATIAQSLVSLSEKNAILSCRIHRELCNKPTPSSELLDESDRIYPHGSFTPVNAVDAFAAYRLPLKKGLTSISFLGRYDYMSDHSKGGKDSDGKLKIADPERHRLTAGVTLSLGTSKLQADLRLNYEQYIYKKESVPSISEQNKLVVEFVVRF